MNVQDSKPRNRTDGIIDRTQWDWYRDAIIYQVHVKAYQDSDGDGMGDFAGLMRRLDHIQELGATAIWLLPFYPSPLRDDGYDIAEYRAINPSYGKMNDFRGFVAEAHKRGLRVITELVINHTSDQHRWFQKARNARKGSAARDFYVWSDDDTKWPETRIIFTDTEPSNWTWDPVAGQFFWHRFFSHQPDLNFDNPRVLQEVIKVMEFWLDMGVDGLRLDAIPYLVERDGTNNENLPETHDVLKKIRAALDQKYTDRMLLAEANQWPEDTRPYFGEGDECHMGFHFPLMPRMYMAIAQEDRHPITDIIRQTPEIPEGCQWGIFLRNHDELTLEMVTDKERDYLWQTYASDKRARINLGIRRRLAPLLQNDRRKIELLNSLLMSMPGTPIIYYGDEIGMGDNYYLGDRDGVRTPMQWSSDRNAGFSRANPQQLYLPAIQDPIYGYQAINVEAQQADASSLLNWMRRMIQVRKNHDVFGRGEMRLLYPSNRKVLAYIRETEDEAVLCVANLSRSAQAAEIDLSAYHGRVPVELTGRSPFPPVGDLPYLLSLPAYGFYWFLLADEVEAPRWHQEVTPILPEFLTLTTRDGKVSTALAGREGAQLERETLPRFLPLQRWFASKDRKIDGVSLTRLAEMDGGKHSLSALEVRLGDETQLYFMPLSAVWGEDSLTHGAATLPATVAKLRRGPNVGALIDGTADKAMTSAMLAALRDDATLDAPDGKLVFRGSDRLRAMEEIGEPRTLSFEQSNASIAFGDKVIMKLYRRLREGVQPDVEVARFLTDVGGFESTPAFLGSIDYERESAGPISLGAAFEYVQNQGDAWAHLTDGLDRELDRAELPVEEDGEVQAFSGPLALGQLLGQRTAEMHRALSVETDDPAFAPEPIRPEDVAGWADEVETEVDANLDRLGQSLPNLSDEGRAMAERVLGHREGLKARLASVRSMTPSGLRTRIHGDYHLGQVLVVKNDFMIIDFEGEPRRPVEERRAKSAPARDVAGMLRSLDYAAWSALNHRTDVTGEHADAARRLAEWRAFATREYLDAYAETMADCRSQPDPEAFRALLDLFLVQKAVYEVGYELASRPLWVTIPLRGLLSIVGDEPE
ncbi:maltose alpha-D-glucosyltransferase [Roseitranquillus sediminis]|uniref:maltose alpha-D-glucosyltransferase n=1 Tax=Roseitranquillus sediminis TaxID=2809051 RepID=UPI001D0CD5B1|nr:maltose alpha-D-glucosyltransferase [Roseitranquillus sediminis]MBM9594888.1 maltose alpha-D-glucosyltransferase [Roseitranquillus sediminis]